MFVVVAAFIESATLPAAEFAIVTVRFAVTFAE
jgi:hypothetical protein